MHVQIESIKADLLALQFALNTTETTDLLIRHLAVTQLLQRAEFVYRLIFGSQLAVMHKLNVSRPLAQAELEPLFQRARNRAPSFYADYTFDQWIGFLLQQSVVTFNDGRYAITLYGREFLGFVVSQGLPSKAH